MPKYFKYKICGYYLYYTSFCIIECMHVHANMLLNMPHDRGLARGSRDARA